MKDFYSYKELDDFGKQLIRFHDQSLNNSKSIFQRIISMFKNDYNRIIGILKYSPSEVYYFSVALRQKCEYIDFDQTTTIGEFNFEKNNFEIKSDIYYLVDFKYNKCTLLYLNGTELVFDQTTTKTTKDFIFT